MLRILLDSWYKGHDSFFLCFQWSMSSSRDSSLISCSYLSTGSYVKTAVLSCTTFMLLAVLSFSKAFCVAASEICKQIIGGTCARRSSSRITVAKVIISWSIIRHATDWCFNNLGLSLINRLREGMSLPLNQGRSCTHNNWRDYGSRSSHRTSAILKCLMHKPLLRPFLDVIALWIFSCKSRSISSRSNRNWLSVCKARLACPVSFSWTSTARRKKGSFAASSSGLGSIAILCISAKSLSWRPPGPPMSGLFVVFIVLTICIILCALMRTSNYGDSRSRWWTSGSLTT